MDESKITKWLVYGQLSQGKRNQGRLCKCFKDKIKARITMAGIHYRELHWGLSQMVFTDIKSNNDLRRGVATI